MSREWISSTDLARAMAGRARSGKNVVLSPETALAVVEHLEGPAASRGPTDRWSVDVHTQGSAVYRLNDKGEAAEIMAFAPNTLVAGAAFEFLCKHYPEDSFSQRRRGLVEAERVVGKRK